MKKLIGIDLGTTNCCIAWMNGNEIVVYKDEEGRSTIPSIVAQTQDGEILVGWRAKNCENPLFRHGFSKRGLGSSQQFPFKDGPWLAFKVSGLVLKELRRLAEAELGCEVAAVITVPAHFLAMHRDETRKAAEFAGLELIELLQEPIAAAIAYYYDEAAQSQYLPPTHTILVYDLGGGTMDATVCVRHGEHIQIGDFGKAYEGDKFLGGIDFDKCLVAMAAAQLEGQGLATTSTIGDDLPSTQWLWELLSSAERCKQKLSDESEVQWTKELVSSSKRVLLNLWVTRTQFEKAVGHLINKTLECCDEALIRQVRRLNPANQTKSRQELVKLAAEKLDRIILVGGSTLMPAIRRRVEEHYDEICGKTPEIRGFRPYECVAIGAAMYAARRPDSGKEDGINWIAGPGDVGQEVDMHPELWGTVTACNGPGWHIELQAGSYKQGAALQANGQFNLAPFALLPGENELQLTILDQQGKEFSKHSRVVKRGGFTIGDPGLAHSIQLRLVDGMEELIPAGTRSGGSASRKTFYINDLQNTARVPLYEGHYPIALFEFRSNAEPGTPVTFSSIYHQGRLKIDIQLGTGLAEEREVNLEISKTRELDALIKDFKNLLQQTEFLLGDLPREGELSDRFRREWEALKLDIETDLRNPIVLDLNRIEDRVCQLAMLHVQLQTYSATAEGLRRQVKETRDRLQNELDLLEKLDLIEAEITDTKQPDELAAVAAQLREVWRNYYQRHPPQIDRTLIEFTLKQLRQHLAAVRRDAKDDEAAMNEAMDLENKIELVVQSDDYPAVFNRLSLFEAKHVNPLYQRVVIRKNQQGLLRSTR